MGSTAGKVVPELRFQQFSQNWKVDRLSTFMTFKNGINADKSHYGSGKKFVNVLDIIADRPIYHDSIIGSVEITEKDFKKNEVIYGDILFQRSSEIREEAGQSNVYLDKDKSATFGGFVIRGRPIVNFNPIYFDYLLKTWSARKEITTKSGGSTRFNVGQDSLGEVVVSYSDNLDEQQKIATFLSSIDEKLNKLRRKRELLETYKRGVMQKIFSQELRFKKKGGADFPDWNERQLSEFLIPTLREVDKPSKEYLAIGVRSHMKGTFQKPGFDPEDIAMETLYVVKENDLVVNITFAWEGAIAIVKKEDEGGLVSHRFPTFTFDRDVATHEFFRHVITQERFKYMLGTISPGGAGRNRVLSKKDFVKLRWNIPCVEEQNKIAEFISTLDKKVEEISSHTAQLETFKKALLQKMFI